MNIKSELDKPIQWFGSISIRMFIFSVILGLVLGLVTIGFGEGTTIIKVLFLVVGGGGTLLFAYGCDDCNKISQEEKDRDAKKGGIVILFAFIVMEICLFSNSGYTQLTPIKTYVRETTKLIILESDPTTGKALKTENKITKTVVFINLDTNQEMGYRNIEDGEYGKDEIMLDIVGKETYIQYLPFLRYNEAYRYVRKSTSIEPQKN